MPTVKVLDIRLPAPGILGQVTYEIALEDGHEYMSQPFHQGAPCYDESRRPIWGWDGREPVTLVPSFLCDLSNRPGVRLHCFLTSGEIRLCSDSTVKTEAP